LHAKFIILNFKQENRGLTTMRAPQAPPQVFRTVDAAAVIDAAPVSRRQREIFLLCSLVTLLDGFNTQSIAFVAPSLVAAWKLSPAQFGPLLSATLLGSVIGVLGVGELADRFGRRWITIAMVALFGTVTLASAAAESITSLMAYRVVAGLGLGGALVACSALTAEYAPRRRRSTLVAVTAWGFPLGAVLGGLLSTMLIAHFGWRSVLLVSGAAPILLVPWLIARLPESIPFLALSVTGQELARRELRRIDPRGQFDSAVCLSVPQSSSRARGVRLLFTHPFTAGSILFPVASFMSLLLTYFLVNWIPLVLHQAGLSIQDAVLGTVVFNLAAIIGSYVLSTHVDRGARPIVLMVWAYCASALAVAAIGWVGAHFWPSMIIIFIAGFLLAGIQMTLMAFVTSSYPPMLRATAVGWVQAVGRVGSLLGPLTAGGLLSLGMLPSQLFATLAIAALLAAAALATLASIGSKGQQA
jgi:MFS transporter, AAHS family, 4-hydroxybenzoate transporter